MFHTQVDILKAKLESGIKVNKYMKSYGERPNDFEAVSKCSRLSLSRRFHVNPLTTGIDSLPQQVFVGVPRVYTSLVGQGVLCSHDKGHRDRCDAWYPQQW